MLSSRDSLQRRAAAPPARRLSLRDKEKTCRRGHRDHRGGTMKYERGTVNKEDLYVRSSFIVHRSYFILSLSVPSVPSVANAFLFSVTSTPASAVTPARRILKSKDDERAGASGGADRGRAARIRARLRRARLPRAPTLRRAAPPPPALL